MNTTNLEEAANIASEFISSLDNLPSEIQHLLQEMRVKESRAQDIYQEINKDSNKYIKHALRQSPASSVPSTPVPSSAPSPSPAPSIQNGNPNGNPKAHLLPKIASSYAEIDRLSTEKIALAQRVLTLLARTRARLEVDLARVGVLQNDTMDHSSPYNGSTLGGGSVLGRDSSFLGGATFPGLAGGGGNSGYVMGGRDPALRIADNLRNTVGTSGGGDIGMPGPSAQKKRRLATQPSVKLNSQASTPIPTPTIPVSAVTAPSASATYSRSRLSNQLHPRSNRRSAATQIQDDEDMDAEGEDDDEADAEEGEDKGLYCFCQQMSHGEMVACDNPECPYQWFHLSCVDIKGPLPETFYCSECLKNGAGAVGYTAPGGNRKGRRK